MRNNYTNVCYVAKGGFVVLYKRLPSSKICEFYIKEAVDTLKSRGYHAVIFSDTLNGIFY